MALKQRGPARASHALTETEGRMTMTDNTRTSLAALLLSCCATFVLIAGNNAVFAAQVATAAA